MARPRDSQRQKVYDAERRAFKDGWEAVPGGRIGRFDMSLAECQEYVDKVVGSAWFRRKHGLSRRIFVKYGRGGTATSSGSLFNGTIKLPGWARCEWVILHEISHNVVTMHHDRRAAAHGPEFCLVYIGLVQHHLGVAAARRLKAEFRKGKVKFGEPPKAPRKPMSPELKAANAERLRRMNAERAAAKAAAKAADPMKVELVQKGNFATSRVCGVHYEIRDLTVGTLLRGDEPSRYAWRDDGTVMIARHAWHRSSLNAGAARQYGPEDARAVAENRPSHEIELRLIGRPRYYGRAEPESRHEVTVFRYEAPEADVVPLVAEPSGQLALAV